MADKQQYFSILTDLGRYKIAKAAADKGEVKFTHFAIGDGGGQETSPVPSQTSLVHEVWRTQIEAADIDPHNPAAVIIAAIIPRTEGGWWMREFGLFDADGDMLAVVKPAPNYKATMAEGQNEDIIYQFQLVVGDNANVVVLIDPSSQYLTLEAADKRYPSREEVKEKYVSKDGLEELGKDWVKKPDMDTAIDGIKTLNQPWLAVLAIDLKAPPAKLNEGDVYLVAAGASGDWKGKDGRIAEWRGETDKWRFTHPLNGHGIGLPNGDVYVRQGGTYKLFQPDLAPYARKDRENEFAEDQTFRKAVKVMGAATFASSVSAAALNVGGSATFSGALTANGAVNFNRGLTLADPTNEAWPFLNFYHGKAGNSRRGLIKCTAEGIPEFQMGRLPDGSLFLWQKDKGDFFTIAPDGNWSSPRLNQVFNNMPGMAVDVLKAYIDEARDSRATWDYVNKTFIAEMKTSGYWDFAGWHTWEASFGPRVVTWCKSDQGKGIYGVTGIGVRDLLYRVGSEWRAPWIG